MIDIVIEITLIKTPLNATIALRDDRPNVQVGLVAPGPPGPQGPQGPDGVSGVLAGHYTHDQMVASSEWLVQHNLGVYASCTCVDTAGTQIFGDIEYVSSDSLVVRFSVLCSGKAFCS